ncbi:MAG: hemolysin III family protein [Rhodothermales bacterium]
MCTTIGQAIFTAEIISIWGVREPVSVFSHVLGALLALVALTVLLRRSEAGGLSRRRRVGFVLYAGSIFFTFTVSALFHYFPWDPDALDVLKRMDHAAIFLVIAGTCTVIVDAGRAAGKNALIAACWLVSLAALAAKMVFWPMALWMSALVYLTVGWTAAVSVLKGLADVPWADLQYLVYGMVVHTVGAVVFVVEAPVLWPGVIEGHELFHVMVLGGIALHFVFVLRYCAVVRCSDHVPEEVNRPVSLIADPQGS